MSQTQAVPGKPTPTPRAISLRKKLAASFLMTGTFTVLLYLGWVVYRTAGMYAEVKTGPSWEGKVGRTDADLGFAAIPNSRGTDVISAEVGVPTRFDRHGFRIPLNARDKSAPPSRPLVLALGCSFTYGHACQAEEAFPYIIGRALTGSSYNAAMSSYGLAQMWVLARRLIPKHRPNYVLVQHAYWLTDRAQSGFAPSYWGKVPTPHFAAAADGGVELRPPAFLTKVCDVPVEDYFGTDTGMGDYLSFQFCIGFPLFVHDDFQMGSYYARRAIGSIPDSAPAECIEQAVYGEIATLCAAHGARMLVVVLSTDASETVVPTFLASLPATMVVNAHETLVKRLRTRDDATYGQQYYHWHGDPPEVLDTHPNARAHKIIAGRIVQAIKAAGW